MSQAISDYAPGSKIIADNKMYTSRYISKYWKNGEKDFDKLYISYCSGCGTLNVAYTNTPADAKCQGCGVSLSGITWEEAISPKAGMVTEIGKPEEVPLVRPKKIYRSDFYYIEEEKTADKVLLDFNDSQVTVISSRKDRIIVTSAKGEPFYVCKKCGYTYGRYDHIRDNNGKLDKVAIGILKGGTKKELNVQRGHNKPTGSPCDCHTFDKKTLFHSFNTDIVQIRFNSSKNIAYNTAVSVLFALIDAISRKLHVERDEISGVIKRDDVSTASGETYRFILFDNVPGGAGHVKQLLDNDYKNLASVLDAAYEKSLNCTCDPKSSCYKCLRTYDNQKYHDVLSRELVVDFLEQYIHAIPKKHVSTKIVVKNATTIPFGDWNSFFKTAKGLFTESAEKVISTLKMPSKVFADIEINGKTIPKKAVLLWQDEGIYIFDKNSESDIKDFSSYPDVILLVGNDSLKECDVSRIKEKN